MDHVKASHMGKMGNKSYFLPDVDVDMLIQRTIMKPFRTKCHVSKQHRTWYVARFNKVIGYRGHDGTPCRWVAVLMKSDYLVTAYPIPHPKALACMR